MRIFPLFRPKKSAGPVFHVLTPTADAGDAVTNDALGMCSALRRAGFGANVYAENIAPAIRGTVLPLSEYERSGLANERDMLLYHHSFGWERGEELYATTHNRKILKYHNITPSHFFQEYSSAMAVAAHTGRAQTRRLVQLGADLYLGDSDFNTRELIEVGADAGRAHTVAPFHQVNELLSVDPDIETVRSALNESVNILFVGRLAPNKGHLNLLRTFAYFRKYVEPNSRLVLVGKINPELLGYGEQIWAAIAEFGLEDSVVSLQNASHQELRALYLTSHVFLCLSEHEGFCVPLVESMLQKVPVVALAASAVPETLGPTGLTVDSIDEPLLAEMMAYCVERFRFRTALTDAQFAHCQQHFTNEAIGARFLELTVGQVH
jgi:glycosyltransferase involved in cell wall biosynthesis